MATVHAPPDAYVHAYDSGLRPSHVLEVMAHMLKGRTFDNLPISRDIDAPRGADILALCAEVDKARFTRRSRRVCLSIGCRGCDVVRLLVTFDPIDPLPADGAAPQMQTPVPQGKKRKTNADDTPPDEPSAGSTSAESAASTGSSSVGAAGHAV